MYEIYNNKNNYIIHNKKTNNFIIYMSKNLYIYNNNNNDYKNMLSDKWQYNYLRILTF